MAAWAATTGRTCKLVMKETSSSAKTFVGSAMASVSVLAARLTGSTSYFLAICGGTRRRMPGSMSSCDSVMDGMPYCRDRKPVSCSFDELQPDEDRSELLSG